MDDDSLMTFQVRFWSSLDRSGDCWLWTGACTQEGYARVRSPFGRHYVHRIAYLLTHGDIPDGMYVCHHCDVRNCCNPDHLFIGTPTDNAWDMIQKGRHAFQTQAYPGERRNIRAKRHDPPARASVRQPRPPIKYRDAHKGARLTDDQIVLIRELHAAGAGGYKTLAVRFGVSKQVIAGIVTGRYHKHVEPPAPGS